MPTDPRWQRLWGVAAAVLLTGLVRGAPPPSEKTLRLLPHGPPPAEELTVVDVRGAPRAVVLAVVTLQGQMNRGTRTRLYINHHGAADELWLRRLQEHGAVKRTRHVTPEAFLAASTPAIPRVYLYDPALSGSANAAVMRCAVHGGVPLTGDLAAKWATGRPTVDLRGRWTNNADAIRSTFQELWPRLSHRALASMNPTSNQLELYDYLVAHRIFTFWIPSAGESERAAVEHVLAESPPVIPVLGFWGSDTDTGVDEYPGLGLSGAHGKFTVGCNTGGNYSVLSGMPVDLSGAVARYRRRAATRSAPVLDPGKVYLSWNMVESGDAPAYLQHLLWSKWNDPMRGLHAFNWAIGPAILDLAPLVMEYFYDQATPQDYFYVAMSGIGYAHPYRGMFSQTQKPDEAWRHYTEWCGIYLRRMGCRDMGLYTDAWLPFERAEADSVTLKFAQGIPGLHSLVLGMGRDEGMTEANATYWLGDPPVFVSHILTRWDPAFAQRTKQENVAWLIREIRAQVPATRPAFLPIMALSWAYDPSDQAAIMAELGPDYVAVTAGELADLKRAHERTTRK